MPPASASEVSFAGAVRSCLPTGFVVVDATRRISALNRAAAAWLGLQSGPAQDSIDTLPQPQRALFEQAWSTPDPVADFTAVLPTGNNGTVSLQVRALRQEPVPGTTLLLLNEAAPAEGLDRQLARLDRLVTLGVLSAGLAHEMRNALVTTKTFVSVLLEKDPGNDLSEIVPREILHIENLLGGMLRHAAPEQTILRIQSIREILERSLRLVAYQVRSRQVTCQTDYQADPGLVKADPDQLQQVFVNLLLNAAEAMEPGGRLTVRTRQTPGRVRVLVEDTGCGIAAEHLERIFSPFFTTKAEGSGLGLAMSRRIVEAHGGTLGVASQPGAGAVFAVDLPAAA